MAKSLECMTQVCLKFHVINRKFECVIMKVAKPITSGVFVLMYHVVAVTFYEGKHIFVRLFK